MQANTGLAVELVKGHSGAFEIRSGGEMLYSKKATGRFPTDEELHALQ